MRVLVTGAAGYLGRHLSPLLSTHHELRLGDLRPDSSDPRSVPLDVLDPDSVRAAMTDIDAVVHLAIASEHEGDFEDDAFDQQRFDVNVRGTWNVLAAAQRAGVRRVVYTSSIMVIWDYPPPDPIPGDAPPRPVGAYAVTKQLGEQLCCYYHQQFGLSVVGLRIAKPIDPADPRWRRQAIRPQWIAFSGLGRAYLLALAAEHVGCEIVTVVGQSSRRRWDLSRAEAVLGYRPQLRLEDLGLRLGNEREPL